MTGAILYLSSNSNFNYFSIHIHIQYYDYLQIQSFAPLSTSQQNKKKKKKKRECPALGVQIGATAGVVTRLTDVQFPKIQSGHCKDPILPLYSTYSGNWWRYKPVLYPLLSNPM